MQEKIEKILTGKIYSRLGPPTGRRIKVGEAATEIAKLFERKVIWEGEGRMALGQGVYDGTISDWTRTLHVQLRGGSMTSAGELLGNKGGQRVCVVVEEIDESG